MTATAKPTEHSLLGASGASRWLKCPGSFRLSQTAPQTGTSVYAARGTLAHHYIEAHLKYQTRMNGESTLGHTSTVDGHDITIDQDFIDGVNEMITYVEGQRCKYRHMLVETHVSLDAFFYQRPSPPPVQLFGRADVILIDRHVIEIVDYKNGSGVIVDPHDNPQCLYYAAGAVAKLMREQPDLDIHKILLTIVQPHARSVAKVRTAEIDWLDLMMWMDDVLIPGVEACAADSAPLNMGSWCRFVLWLSRVLR